MKKRLAAVLTLMMMTVFLTACGRSYDADTGTLYILKNGKVVSTDVEAFDEASYDKAELESYVKDVIGEYTQEHGKNTVRLNRLDVSSGIATLTLEYASPSDYVDFNGTFLFVGSVAEALAAGYTFEGDFVSASDGSACATSAVIDDGSLRVAVVRSVTDLSVSGNIVYYSGEYTKLLDKKTISISPDNRESETDGEPSGTEAVETDAAETESLLADENSVSDDEMLTGEEEQEVVFDFGDDSGEISAAAVDVGYIYVIYK